MFEPQKFADATRARVRVVIYRERVHAPISLWVAVSAMTASLGVAYGHVLGNAWGLATFALTQGLAAWWLLGTAPLISVTATDLQVGPARLPVSFIGSVALLDRDRTKAARGPRAEPHSFMRLRPGVPESVVVEVTDSEDPHPYWMISSRRPEVLRAALVDAAAQSTTR